MKNKTTINRTLKDSKHLYNKFSIEINKLPFIESAIMYCLLSNSDDWIVNKKQIKKNSELGRVIFDNAWNNLIQLGHIQRNRIQGGWKYIIHESTDDGNVTCEIPQVTEMTLVRSVALTITNKETIQAIPKIEKNSGLRNEEKEEFANTGPKK